MLAALLLTALSEGAWTFLRTGDFCFETLLCSLKLLGHIYGEKIWHRLALAGFNKAAPVCARSPGSWSILCSLRGRDTSVCTKSHPNCPIPHDNDTGLVSSSQHRPWEFFLPSATPGMNAQQHSAGETSAFTASGCCRRLGFMMVGLPSCLWAPAPGCIEPCSASLRAQLLKPSAAPQLDVAHLTSSLLIHRARQVLRGLAFRFLNHAQLLLRHTETFISSLAPAETSACPCAQGKAVIGEGIERDGVARCEQGGCCCSPWSLAGGAGSPAVAVSICVGLLGRRPS